MILPEFFEAPPCVYAVGNEYQIIVPVFQECLMWVRVGTEEYYDDSNGILRSASHTHKMIVPMAELDKAKEYTVCFRIVGQRLPYFSKTGQVEEFSFPFRPVEQVYSRPLHVYMISDTHSRINAPVECGKYFGDKLDLLLLNGDIPDHSGDVKNFVAFHKIAGHITNGSLPVVFARGNHDLRGICAELLADHTPTQNGRSYYTFRLGYIWGIVMDCGEDKEDSHEAYGNTNCCHAFRRRETKFLEEVIRNAKDEYEADGVTLKLVLCHVPFSDISVPPFDIEKDLYKYWCTLLRENVKPDLMLCGHKHNCYVSHKGSSYDKQGQPCTVVVGGKPGKSYWEQYETALEITGKEAHVMYTDQEHKILSEETFSIPE
ncbi:MAG: metallophosphoesterase [Lentisphaeria bacterium]|nr:metallophosphoesterase [Lentisphaeria bacterium]